MNDRLLKEVEAGADEITQLKMKAARRAAAEQCRREKEAADRREEQVSQLGNALKAAEKAKATEQEAWVTKEANWGRERDNLLEAYEKCRQGMERAVDKLREEKEKQKTAEEEERRSIRMMRRMRGCLPPASESGGEQTRGLTSATGRRAATESVGKPAGNGGPLAGLGPSRKGDGPRRGDRGDRGAGPRWREEQWRSEQGLEYRDRWEGTRGTMRPADGRRQEENRWMDKRCYSLEPREKGRW